jgi:hypothetical protein
MFTPAAASGSKMARAMRVLLDERARGVLEGAQDLDDDVVDPAELDRPDLHDLGALVGELEHLLVADDR